MRDFTDQERMTTLRGLVARSEWAGLCSFLEERWSYDVLQFLGEGLRPAVLDGAEAAAVPARRCATELRVRDWDGDAELAFELDAALANTSLVAGLTPLPVDLEDLPVDLEDLSMSLEGDPMQGGGRIDLTTGEVWPDFVLETSEEGLADDDLTRWHNFSNERRRGRARAWLAGEGYQAVGEARSP